MKISTVLGSALGVLLVFSVISYAKDLIRTQDKKAAVQSSQGSQMTDQKGETAELTAILETAADVTAATGSGATLPAQVYSATAYSLRGRTATGQSVTRGIIAADPRVLPLGTRVRLDAGQWSGEYMVADTGGAIKGRKIDIWTPSNREAMQFGRRPVKLTVLSFPKRVAKGVRSRAVKPTPSNAVVADSTDKQQK